MNLHLSIGPVVSLIAGILILVVSRLLNYIVAIYPIVIGLMACSGRGRSSCRPGPVYRAAWLLPVTAAIFAAACFSWLTSVAIRSGGIREEIADTLSAMYGRW